MYRHISCSKLERLPQADVYLGFSVFSFCFLERVSIKCELWLSQLKLFVAKGLKTMCRHVIQFRRHPPYKLSGDRSASQKKNVCNCCRFLFASVSLEVNRLRKRETRVSTFLFKVSGNSFWHAHSYFPYHCLTSPRRAVGSCGQWKFRLIWLSAPHNTSVIFPTPTHTHTHIFVCAKEREYKRDKICPKI